MKDNQKSALLRATAAIIFLSWLGGCEDVRWPQAFTGQDVPQEVLDQPRIVAAPPSLADKTYPYVGTVPSKPNDFTPKKRSDRMIGEMEGFRDEAKILQEWVESEYPPYPPVSSALPVPSVLPSQPPTPYSASQSVPEAEPPLGPGLTPPQLRRTPQP